MYPSPQFSEQSGLHIRKGGEEAGLACDFFGELLLEQMELKAPIVSTPGLSLPLGKKS